MHVHTELPEVDLREPMCISDKLILRLRLLETELIQTPFCLYLGFLSIFQLSFQPQSKFLQLFQFYFLLFPYSFRSPFMANQLFTSTLQLLLRFFIYLFSQLYFTP